MTHQPNEYWLKYMLVFSGATREQICAAAEMYQFTPPTLQYLRELDDTLSATKPTPFRGDRSECRSWTRRQRIMSLATEDPHAVAARELLSDNKVRTVLESLILADMPVAEIATYVGLITKRVVAQDTIDKYRHYFWNRDLLSVGEWDTYLRDHPRRNHLWTAYQRGPELALWTLGYRIEMTKQEVLNLILHESTMRFAELGTFPNGIKTATSAKFWADNAFKAIEGLEKTGDSVKQVVEELRAVSIKLGRRDITSIDKRRRALPPEEKK